MPRIKTNRSAAKRFRVTGTGKLRRNHAFANHMLSKKSAKRKRGLRKSTIVDASEEKRVRKLLAI